MMDLFSKFIPLLLSYTRLLTVLQGQRVDILSETIAYQSYDVTLPCHFVHGPTEEKLIQVEWTWQNPSNKNVSVKVILFNVEHGINPNNTFLKNRVSFSTNPNLTFDASIIIKHVKLTDQGVYSCGYTTYPSGSRSGVTTLKVEEGKPPLLSTAATAGIVTVILITMTLASVGYLLINKNRRAASTSVSYITQSPDDLQQGEITYADVTVKSGKINKNTSQTEDIEYAAVSFSGRSGKTSQRASANQIAFSDHTAKDASVYKEVKKINFDY
ncbi:uncharacterized protein [Paramisgurnus dabryanus]|uniref:uncharacterized protein n=1 Tax=Paramisgurnus dabryanus TaxID=90735 RepID=UPI0031F39EC0